MVVQLACVIYMHPCGLPRWGQSTNQEIKELYVCVCLVYRCYVMCVSIVQRRQDGEVWVFASTFCIYDLRKGDLFVLSWASAQQVLLRL